MNFCSILPFQFATLSKAQKSNEGGDQDHAMGLNIVILEETGYEKRQTSMIKTTVLQFMLEAP